MNKTNIRFLLCFILIASLSGCKKSEAPSTIKAAYVDPPIAVVFDNGERAFTEEEYSRALLRISGTTNNNIDSEDTTKTVDNPIVSASPADSQEDSVILSETPQETLKDITDHASIVATLSIALRTILNEYADGKYTADFGYDSGTINFYGVNATDQKVKELEDYLTNTAAEIGLPDYNIKINLLKEGEKTTGETNNPETSGDYNFNTYNNPENQNTTDKYVLNTNPDRMKIHYPSCNDVLKIKYPENYDTTNLSIAELKALGYTPCGHCNPHD